MALLYIIVILVSLYLYKTKFLNAKSNGLNGLPEAPGRIPILGHVFLISRTMYKTFAKLGDIFTIYIGPQRFIIINSPKVINDLIEKRGAIYSSKKPSYLLTTTLLRDRSIFGSPYNEWYRKAQPLAHGFLTRQKVESYYDLIEQGTNDLINKILKDGNKSDGIDPDRYLRFTSFNMIINILFAIQLEDFNDQIYQKLENGYARILEALGFKNLLPNLFPIFLSFPPYRKELSNIIQLRDELETLMRGLLKRVEDDLEKKPCVSQDFLQKLNEGSIDESGVITLCNEFMLAGTEGVALTICWLIAILANHPEFQQKAHEELDKVVGRERLPNVSDFNSLPYIQSLIKETLRWRPTNPAPLRFLEKDDEYLGYHIPKNSMIYLNVYALNFDENRYQNPDVFNPDRFFDSKESIAASAKGPYQNRDHYSFSIGRRSCTGIHLAEAELLSILSGLLWSFKIENLRRDATGRVLPIDLNNSFKSFLQTPNPFNVRFIPRH